MITSVKEVRSVKSYFPDSLEGSVVGMLDLSPDRQTYRTEWAHHHWIDNTLEVNDWLLQSLHYIHKLANTLTNIRLIDCMPELILTYPGQSLDQFLKAEVLTCFVMIQ